ncbi:rid1 [Drechmeria coniospora]|uniref:DNA (cytosine-5-)-methyltransferase n=1 Tax=Drechmeria coniospora TaxID=98403 RepID=A0A151GS21_DRECN|nr:rid1 [Drechmeria coniospora]KYK59907.1 rid1 [Drechmeria coniospora]ODA78704.2 hypothetical protein RJ55_06086 [Drechmeria coniospora]
MMEGSNTSAASMCTITGHDPQFDPDIIFDHEVIDLTEGATFNTHSLRDGEHPLEKVRIRHQTFERGDVAEAKQLALGAYPIEFLQIKTIVRDYAGHVILRGIPITRTRNLMGKLPKKLNEVCMVLHIDRGTMGTTTNESSIFIDVHPGSIVRKRKFTLTNSIYPDHCSCSVMALPGFDRDRYRRSAERTGRLVCRWVMKIYFTMQGRRTRPDEEVLERISASEVSNLRFKTSDETLRNRWRGGRVKGGSWNGNTAFHGNVVSLDVPSCHRPSRSRGFGQKYTLFDAFAGAGGASRGAQSAGFKVLYAIDKSPDVWDTYQANFPETMLYGMSVDEFVQSTRRELLRADVLHLSPPCQYFSPAHTRQAAHDDENIFALFGCNELINRIRPRMITVEQTFGITHDRHQKYLKTLIGDFTQFGYSVRWKVVRLCHWGSAQDRKRLIVIAAAPGESLPPFPLDSHSESGRAGCKPFTTIWSAIRGIRPRDPLHSIRDVKKHHPPRPALDTSRLVGTITTGAGGIYHPDGTRDLTLREYACLQGFPPNHQFVGTKTSIRRQIGNAFPPNTVEMLYQHLQDWLLKADGFTLCQLPEENVYVIDDEGDFISDSNSTPRFGTTSLPFDDFVQLDDDFMFSSRQILERRSDFVDLT